MMDALDCKRLSRLALAAKDLEWLQWSKAIISLLDGAGQTAGAYRPHQQHSVAAG
jgi:hypothetical protein